MVGIRRRNCEHLGELLGRLVGALMGGLLGWALGEALGKALGRLRGEALWAFEYLDQHMIQTSTPPGWI